MQEKILDNSESLDTWAYIEIFGHDRLAGRITERKMGTSIMLQVDVPKGDTEFSHTELFSPSSIFSIKPTTEEWCRAYAKRSSGFSRNIIPYIPVGNQLTEAKEVNPLDDENNDSEFYE